MREGWEGLQEVTYRCLNHLHPLSSHLPDGTSYVHHSLLLYLLQDCVYRNQCSRAPHTSTAGSQGSP